MICKKCGSENYRVVRALRNKRWDSEKNVWVFDQNADTRELICRDCDARYYTTTYMDYAIIYDEDKLKLQRVPIEKFKNEMEKRIGKRQSRLFKD